MRPIALLLIAAAALAHAQSASFTVSQNGKPVGTASFTFTRTAAGFNSTSLVRVQMQGLDYSISKEEQLSASSALQHVLLSAVVNGSAVNVTAAAKPDGLLLNTSAQGRAQTQRFDAHPAAVFLPDLDPGALETLVTLAVEHGNADLWVLLPKGQGQLESVQLATLPDEQGTLDSRPITVHHLQATYAGLTTDLFSGPKNELVLAELPQRGFALVRDGFVIAQPAKPGAPPPAPAQPTAPATPSQPLPPQPTVL